MIFIFEVVFLFEIILCLNLVFIYEIILIFRFVYIFEAVFIFEVVLIFMSSLFSVLLHFFRGSSFLRSHLFLRSSFFLRQGYFLSLSSFLGLFFIWIRLKSYECGIALPRSCVAGVTIFWISEALEQLPETRALTLSRGGGKNACATYFGHISVISSWIRVVSKANVNSTYWGPM